MFFVLRTICPVALCVFCIFCKDKDPKSWLSFWHANNFVQILRALATFLWLPECTEWFLVFLGVGLLCFGTPPKWTQLAARMKKGIANPWLLMLHQKLLIDELFEKMQIFKSFMIISAASCFLLPRFVVFLLSSSVRTILPNFMQDERKELLFWMSMALFNELPFVQRLEFVWTCWCFAKGADKCRAVLERWVSPKGIFVPTSYPAVQFPESSCFALRQ